MSSDNLLHESPALPRWTYEDEVQVMADYFADPPQPAPGDRGADGGRPVSTQRGVPDPDPLWPGSGHVNASEWALIHEPEISGRAIAFNAFHRNGGERYVGQDTETLPVLPAMPETPLRQPVRDDVPPATDMVRRANAGMTIVLPLMLGIIAVITLLNR